MKVTYVDGKWCVEATATERRKLSAAAEILAPLAELPTSVQAQAVTARDAIDAILATLPEAKVAEPV